jgi:hypothetical protein
LVKNISGKSQNNTFFYYDNSMIDELLVINWIELCAF